VDRKAIIKQILDNLHVHSKFPRDPCLYITTKEEDWQQKKIGSEGGPVLGPKIISIKDVFQFQYYSFLCYTTCITK
jgi:hypothetical protein